VLHDSIGRVPPAICAGVVAKRVESV